MTSSGSFVKVPTDEEEERIRKAAEDSQKRREEAKKKREMEELMKRLEKILRNAGAHMVVEPLEVLLPFKTLNCAQGIA
jgi:hypothetical protein